MGSIQGIWILSEDGKIIFNKIGNLKINSDQFPMLLLAINSFAEKFLNADGIFYFKIGVLNFYLIKKNKFLFIASNLRKTKKKKVVKKLNLIINHFFNHYHSKKLIN